MYNEIKSIKKPTEEDCYLGIIRAYQREVDGLQQENKQLKEEIDLQFKDLMKRIQENNDEYLEEKNKLIKENHHYKKILTELEEWLCGEKIVVYNVDGKVGILRGDILNKIQELKEKYK